MNNSHPAGDPRAELVGRLTQMNELLRWIDNRWQAKWSIAQQYQPSVPLKQKWKLGPYALIFGILTVGLTIIGTAVFRAIGQAELEEQGRSSLVNMQPLAVAIIAFPLALILAFGVVLVRNRVLLPRQHNQAERVNEQRKANNAAVGVEEQQVDAQLQQAGQNFATHIGSGFFPREYLHEEAVGFCIQVVRNHRANSVTDALNLYETELHRRRVEDLQAAQLAEAQRARKLQAVGNVMNATMQGAAIGSMRQEAAQTRASNAANTARLTEELKKPRTVHIKKPGGLW